MKKIVFSTKQQTKVYTLFTLISIVIGLFIFNSVEEQAISSSVAYLLVTIISAISLYFSLKEGSKTFRQITVVDEKLELFFVNKLRNKLVIYIDDVIVREEKDKLKIFERSTSKLLGVAYRNRIKGDDNYTELLQCLGIYQDFL